VGGAGERAETTSGAYLRLTIQGLALEWKSGCTTYEEFPLFSEGFQLIPKILQARDTAEVCVVPPIEVEKEHQLSTLMSLAFAIIMPAIENGNDICVRRRVLDQSKLVTQADEKIGGCQTIESPFAVVIGLLLHVIEKCLIF